MIDISANIMVVIVSLIHIQRRARCRKSVQRFFSVIIILFKLALAQVSKQVLAQVREQPTCATAQVLAKYLRKYVSEKVLAKKRK